MGATLLDGVVVEKNAMVAAGALVRQNTKIPCGEVCLLSSSDLFVPVIFLMSNMIAGSSFFSLVNGFLIDLVCLENTIATIQKRKRKME